MVINFKTIRLLRRPRIPRLIALVAVLCLGGCRLSFQIPEHVPVRLSIRNNVEGIDDRTLTSDSPIIRYLNNWFRQNQEGWEYAYVDRPQYVAVKSTSFNVNIREDEVTVKTCRLKYRCDLWVKKNAVLLNELRARHLMIRQP